MAQTLTLKIKLKPTSAQIKLLSDSSLAYIETVNSLVSKMVEAKASTKKTSKDIVAPLNSAVKNQAIRDAKSVYQKAKKTKYSIVPVLKKRAIFWNNQNYSIELTTISMPFMIDGKSKKIQIQADIQPWQLDVIKLAIKKGTLRVTPKNKHWIAQVPLEVPTKLNSSTKILGVDLGIKVPAVAVTDENESAFFGNGRKNKYIRRYHKNRRKVLGKEKKLKAVKKSKDKEQRYMNDQDHKISRKIVNYAVDKRVGIIRLEQLANIRQTARTSRKNNNSLHSWSFYRLSSYIEYKANLVGIKVEYVNPKYTSQACPMCETRNKAKDRIYKCGCGFQQHRDLVGAMNIRYAPVIGGNSQLA
jgi:IS605 OrfB family transposase